jgi:hypothetical protein
LKLNCPRLGSVASHFIATDCKSANKHQQRARKRTILGSNGAKFASDEVCLTAVIADGKRCTDVGAALLLDSSVQGVGLASLER